MERLKDEQITRNSILFAIRCNFPRFCGEERAEEASKFIRKQFAELEKYRDIGTLDQIKTLQAELKKFRNMAAKLKIENDDYMRKIADGTMIELPCKVGTPVWVIEVDEENFEAFYCSTKITKMKFELWMIDLVGTAVFLSLEEAEAAKDGESDG